VQGLISRRLVSDESSFNSRVAKYQHRFCNTEFGDLQLSEQERGIVCVLLLRGPQTPGEIRTRTNRLANFTDVKQVEAILDEMSNRAGGALVVKLPREAGKRESRYAHLFCGEVDVEAMSVLSGVATPAPASSSRMDALETELSELKQEVRELRAIIDELTG
jgi:uncharacterized protein YceH (UPF0502 family)